MLKLHHQDKVVTSVYCLTTLEPCLVQARVRGGFPVHAQVKAASIPISTVIGLGSDSSLGPTRVKQRRKTVKINKRLSLEYLYKISKYSVLFPTVKLTLDINQCADIGAAHRVGHLTRDRVCEVGVVHCHLKAVPICFRDGNSSFRPPGTDE